MPSRASNPCEGCTRPFGRGGQPRRNPRRLSISRAPGYHGGARIRRAPSRPSGASHCLMRFLVDEQLPPVLARWLSDGGRPAEHVADVLLGSAPDPAIWDYALSVSAAIVTKDEDFAERRTRSTLGPVVVWVRLPNTRKRDLLKLVRERHARHPHSPGARRDPCRGNLNGIRLTFAPGGPMCLPRFGFSGRCRRSSRVRVALTRDLACRAPIELQADRPATRGAPPKTHRLWRSPAQGAALVVRP